MRRAAKCRITYMSGSHHMRVMNLFAKKLKAARIDGGYDSAAKFADALGIEPPTYRTYERGEASPPLPILARVCDLLDIFPNDLLLAGKQTDNSRAILSQRTSDVAA